MGKRQQTASFRHDGNPVHLLVSNYLTKQQKNVQQDIVDFNSILKAMNIWRRRCERKVENLSEECNQEHSQPTLNLQKPRVTIETVNPVFLQKF
jgi:hypothetical protein